MTSPAIYRWGDGIGVPAGRLNHCKLSRPARTSQAYLLSDPAMNRWASFIRSLRDQVLNFVSPPRPGVTFARRREQPLVASASCNGRPLCSLRRRRAS